MSDRLPGKVPLHAVEDYTENIHFDGLGLPAQFDEERLQLHLRSLERVRSWAGLGDLTIRASYQYEQETSAASHVSVEFTPPLTRLGAIHEVPHTAIGINLQHRDRQLYKAQEHTKEPKLKQAMAISPEFHAEFLDNSLRKGLREASTAANLGVKQGFMTAYMYLSMAWLGAAFDVKAPDVAAFELLLRPVLVNGTVIARHVKDSYVSPELPKAQQPTLEERLERVRQSMLIGAQLDRLALGVVATDMSTFVSVKK
jgi:hypothetical protein